MIVDWHSHWIPPQLLPRISAFRPQPLAPEFSDVDARLEYMRAAGVDRQAISFPTTFGADAALPPADAAALYRDYNDHLGGLLAGNPTKFWGLAGVPTADPEQALAEFERTLGVPGMIGIVLPADAFLTPAVAAPYRPLLAAVHRSRRHIYVHSGPTGPDRPGARAIEFLRIDAGSERWLLEAGTRLGAAALTLERSALLDDFPGLSVHVAMFGGHLAWIAETLALRASGGTGAAAAAWPLRRIYVDTGILKPGGQALRQAAAMFGEDRLVYGSDFPLFGTRQPLEAYTAGGLTSQLQERILHRNSAELLSHLALPGLT
jgi:aminocarboxymuconate-semialdehyde decarboxylase